MFKFNIETKDEEMAGLIEILKDLGTKWRGVTLTAERKDDVTMGEVVENLKESGRDFFTADSDIANRIETRAEKEIIKRLDAAIAKKRPEPGADVLGAVVLRAAMDEFMKCVVERIEQQRVNGGGSPKDLSKSYKSYKNSKYGFVYPIGKATAQLLEALTPGGGTTGKIKLETT